MKRHVFSSVLFVASCMVMSVNASQQNNDNSANEEPVLPYLHIRLRGNGISNVNQLGQLRSMSAGESFPAAFVLRSNRPFPNLDQVRNAPRLPGNSPEDMAQLRLFAAQLSARHYTGSIAPRPTAVNQDQKANNDNKEQQ
jgi:hypothetical protein